jgi:hypothetical protein
MTGAMEKLGNMHSVTKQVRQNVGHIVGRWLSGSHFQFHGTSESNQ